jgi:protein-tyrosine phosphatase
LRLSALKVLLDMPHPLHPAIVRLMLRLLSLLLSHPWALAIMAPIIDVVWQVRRLTVRNPPSVVRPRSVLFVCKGNICRSPFAALAAARWLENSGIREVSCVSSGFRVSRENGPPREAVEASRGFGLALDAHRSVPLTDAMVEASDAIVVMEPAHFRLLRRKYPGARRRIYLLALFGPKSERNRGNTRCAIPDPFGQPVEAYRTCYQRITNALNDMLTQMFPQRG